MQGNFIACYIARMIAHPGPPLSGFQHLKTTRLGVLESGVGRFFPGAKFEFGSDTRTLDAISNRCQLRDIALAYSRVGARVRIGIPDLGVYALLFAFSGGAKANVGSKEIEIASNQALMASGSGSVRLDYGAEFEHLLLSISPQALTTKLEAMTGVTVCDRPAFEAQADFRRADTENLRRTFMFLVDCLDSPAPLHPVALAELEQLVIVSFLVANDSNYASLLRRRALLTAPWHVRLAEAYIEANWDQPLTIEALARVTAVSARTLFHSFRRHRGYSPMEFVKRLRLDRARRMLLNSDSTTSVTAVAFTCGFGNLGHFAGYYQHAFGETPSVTLRRATRS